MSADKIHVMPKITAYINNHQAPIVDVVVLQTIFLEKLSCTIPELMYTINALENRYKLHPHSQGSASSDRMTNNACVRNKTKNKMIKNKTI